ncbi:MAG: DNA-directed RNA polymerase subunit K [Caldisphaera sp.]|jgi:DNA-directed RNA polymerase subunit K|uniref:DNA-directed RNA polymerase subunit K n=1 Tax=Caldisphaera sp. TaxID=2060322 RepID=UPI00397C3E82
MSGSYMAYPKIREDIIIGPPYLTKYEKAKIIGIRSLQLTHNAPPLIKTELINSTDPVDIARYEVENGILPVSVIRYTPSGLKQVIPIKLLLKGNI